MKRKTRNVLVNVLIVIMVLALAFILVNRPFEDIEKNVAVCIGKNSVLYTQAGCSHCGVQKQMFGENLKYLTLIDCTETPEECLEISKIPTWIIDGKEYVGVQSIEKLKELTGC